MPFEEYTNTEREQRVGYVVSTLMQNPEMGMELLYDLPDEEVAEVLATTSLLNSGVVFGVTVIRVRVMRDGQ